MNAAFSQSGREEIIQHKIKSITKSYLMGNPESVTKGKTDNTFLIVMNFWIEHSLI